MRILRHMLSVLVLASLVLAPLPGHTAGSPVPVRSASVAGATGAKMAMDCPGHSTPAKQGEQTPEHLKCPACPDGSCNSSACQAKCAAAVSHTVEPQPSELPDTTALYDTGPHQSYRVQTLQPQPPPPRP